MAVEFFSWLVGVVQEIENDHSAAEFQDFVSGVECPLRGGGMVQGLTEKSDIHRVGIDRRSLNVAESVFQIQNAVLSSKLGAELHHLFRIVDRDDVLSRSCQQLGQSAFAGTKIRNHHRR